MVRTCLDRADADGFEMEAALEEAGSRELYDLRRNARPLGVVADVAPLLGLMGTVIGMIKAFEVVAHSGALGRTELLAEGIGEALITTAFGLAVAVPSIIAYHYFRARADGFVRAMEDECLDIVNALRRMRRQS
jgi:biopolymer transport protein ExbB